MAMSTLMRILNIMTAFSQKKKKALVTCPWEDYTKWAYILYQFELIKEIQKYKM